MHTNRPRCAQGSQCICALPLPNTNVSFLAGTQPSGEAVSPAIPPDLELGPQLHQAGVFPTQPGSASAMQSSKLHDPATVGMLPRCGKLHLDGVFYVRQDLSAVFVGIVMFYILYIQITVLLN